MDAVKYGLLAIGKYLATVSIVAVILWILANLAGRVLDYSLGPEWILYIAGVLLFYQMFKLVQPAERPWRRDQYRK